MGINEIYWLVPAITSAIGGFSALIVSNRWNYLIQKGANQAGISGLIDGATASDESITRSKRAIFMYNLTHGMPAIFLTGVGIGLVGGLGLDYLIHEYTGLDYFISSVRDNYSLLFSETARTVMESAPMKYALHLKESMIENVEKTYKLVGSSPLREKASNLMHSFQIPINTMKVNILSNLYQHALKT